jgi:hypothetical protein
MQLDKYISPFRRPDKQNSVHGHNKYISFVRHLIMKCRKRTFHLLQKMELVSWTRQNNGVDLVELQGPPKKCIHTLTEGICVLFSKLNYRYNM